MTNQFGYLTAPNLALKPKFLDLAMRVKSVPKLNSKF